MTTTLITGGSGFIGSALVGALLQHGDDAVVNFDKLSYAAVPESLEAFKSHPRYRFEHADITDESALRAALERHRPARVFHLAAESHVDRSITDPGAFIHTNVVGTCVLLRLCQDYWSQMTGAERDSFRFIHISTDEVFGDLPHPDDAGDDAAARDRLAQERFSEDSAYAPSSPYSASKASSDHFVRAWHRTYGLPVLIGNCSNNYGPRQLPEKLIPRIITNAIAAQPLPVYGRGHQIRDWLYVDDHADALLTIAAHGRPGSSYNIGADCERRNIDIIKEICALLEELAPEKPAGVSRYVDLIKHVDDRPGHDRRYAIDAGKIHRELGWKTQVGFAEGLRRTVAWYLSNQSWCHSAVARASQDVGT